MRNDLLRWIVLLAIALAGLWLLDAHLQNRLQAERDRASRFHLMAGDDGPSTDEATRLELTLPGADRTWRYVRDTTGWRIPDYRNAYAQSEPVEFIVKAALEGRGTPAPPADRAARFGLDPDESLSIAVFSEDRTEPLRLRVGRAAPGRRADEAAVLRERDGMIFQLDANPRSAVAGSTDDRYPPLLDRRVIPAALKRRSIAQLTLAGPWAGGLGRMTRTEIPPDPASPEPDRGPRYTWAARMSDGGTKAIPEPAARTFCRSLIETTFVELLEPGTEPERAFPRLLLTLVLETEDGETDTLELRSDAAGRAGIVNRTTGQLFELASDVAAAMRPTNHPDLGL